MPFDRYKPYPRLCAHRGYHSIAPENTMPAFGAAVAMGADEIEFDLWETADGKLVTAHDSKLERVSDGTGLVSEHTLSELKALDFGSRFSEHYKDLRLPTFEEILQKFAGRVIMNIHVKFWKEGKMPRMIEEIASLIEKYDCVRHVYFVSSDAASLLAMRERLPAAGFCQGAGKGNDVMVELAVKYGFDKGQFVSWHPYDQGMIDRLRAHGIRCNFCGTNDPAKARELFKMGIDCILTDDFHRVKTELERE